MIGSRCVGGDIVTLRWFGGQFVRRGVEGGREGGTWLLGGGLGVVVVVVVIIIIGMSCPTH